jgi:hypothetical protein
MTPVEGVQHHPPEPRENWYSSQHKSDLPELRAWGAQREDNLLASSEAGQGPESE